MENTQNNLNNIADRSLGDNKKTVLVTIIAGLAVLGALIWWMRQAPTPQQAGTSSPTPDAEAAAINQGVDSVNVGDLNAEFEAIDKDLQGL